MQQQVAELGVSMCKAVEFGKCDEGIYSVHTKEDKNVKLIFYMYLQGKSVIGIVKELECLGRLDLID